MRSERGGILPGIIIAVFVLLLAAPVLYNSMAGGAGAVPELKYPAGETQCIESKEYMRENHMQLIMDWRDSVVRDGNRTYVASDGKEYNMSLTGECLGCHSNKAEFCDQCHTYLKVKPYCWECHVIPKEDA